MGAFLRRNPSASPYKNKPHVDSGAKVPDNHMGMGRKKRRGWKNIQIRSYSFIPYFVCMLFHLFRSFVFCFFCSFFCSFVALFVLSFPPSFCLCFCLYQLTIISSFLVVLLSFFLHVFISLSLCLSVCLSSVCLSFSVFLYQSINVFRLLIFWFFLVINFAALL